MKQKSLEQRISALERYVDWAKPTVVKIAKQLSLSLRRVNPAIYCKDDLDRKIVAYLLENEAAGATEIAEALGLEKPKYVGRHTIGKRIKRLRQVSDRDGWNLFTFHPEVKEGKFRAWWVNLEEIDIEAFKKSAKI